jgi:transposase
LWAVNVDTRTRLASEPAIEDQINRGRFLTIDVSLVFMSMPRTADGQAYLRRLALKRLDAGKTQVEVARLLEVGERSVRRWMAARRVGGDEALISRSSPGRPPKLSNEQAALVVAWLEQSPCTFGFPTERWTAPRVAQLIDRQLGVGFHPRYLNDWLGRRGITPQIPKRTPRERDEQEIQRWMRYVWPNIKKKRWSWMQDWLLRMKPAF